MLAGLILVWLAVRLLWVSRDRQKAKEELRGEPPFGGASSFAGLGVPFLSGHVADLYGFSRWR
jgi:hypothetical protein